MIPTNRLRFVEREEKSNLSADGRLLPHDVTRVITRRTLQQWWRQDRPHGQIIGMDGEWRDVPLEEEE